LSHLYILVHVDVGVTLSSQCLECT